MYTLPDAPPRTEWVALDQVEEDPEVAMRRFLDAKRAAIQCFAALADRNWDKALSWMSQETRAFFDAHSNEQGAAAAFEQGTLWIDGKSLTFDPSADVFIAGLTDIRDEFGQRTDTESQTRKVLYAVDDSNHARELVFIVESDRWVLDMNTISFDLLTP